MNLLLGVIFLGIVLCLFTLLQVRHQMVEKQWER